MKMGGNNGGRPPRQFALDRLFLSRFGHVMSVVFPSVFSATFLLFIFLFLLCVLDQIVTYFTGVIASDFYVVLGNKDHRGFELQSYKAFLTVMAKVVTLSTINYVSSMLYVNWRQLLCRRLHGLYFRNRVFYDLNVVNAGIIDNPDQRMTQDVDKMCNSFSTIFWQLVILPFVVGYYTYKTYASTGYLGPLTIYIFFILGTVVNRLIMNPVVRLTVQQERQEGNFRYKHMAIRSHSEAIGFYNSGRLERTLTNESLEQLLGTQSRLIQWRYGLQFGTSTFDYVGSILSYLILGFAIFGIGRYDHVSSVELSGIVSKNSFFYMYLINSFTRIIDLAGKFSDMAGSLHRVAEMLEYTEERIRKKEQHVEHNLSTSAPFGGPDWTDEAPSTYQREGSINNCYTEKPGSEHAFLIRNLTYHAPDDLQPLLKALSISITSSDYLLISGDSSSGKTSFYRVLAGLWKGSGGEIENFLRYTPGEVMFVPQKPYLTHGTLRQQITYPLRATCPGKYSADEDKLMEELLDTVNMRSLLDRCQGWDNLVDWVWHDILSPGETQRIAFARILYHRPKFAFLDESTSAVGFDMERVMYSALLSYGVSYVSIGHRASLRRFHNRELRFDGDGSWSIGPVAESSLDSMFFKNSSTNNLIAADREGGGDGNNRLSQFSTGSCSQDANNYGTKNAFV